jgi:putative tricarboxylic transport membrane protein
MKIQNRSIARIGLVAALSVLAACGSSSASGGSDDGSPTGPVEFVVPFSSGGGPDLVARTMSKIMDDSGIVDKRFQVENVEGGNALVGMTSVASHKGQAGPLLITGTHLVSTPLLQKSSVNYDDFTPLALVCTEYVYVFVAPKSPLKNADDLAAALKADPTSLTIGGSVTGGPSHLAIMEFADALGVDTSKVTYIPYDGADAITALLGGQIDIATSGPDTLDLAKGGELRAIAVSSPDPLQGDSAGIETFREAGAETDYVNWRVIVGPPDMPAAAVKYWKNAFAKMEATDAWKKALAANGWSPLFKTDGLEEYLASESDRYKTIMTQLGLIDG